MTDIKTLSDTNKTTFFFATSSAGSSCSSPACWHQALRLEKPTSLNFGLAAGLGHGALQNGPTPRKLFFFSEGAPFEPGVHGVGLKFFGTREQSPLTQNIGVWLGSQMH